MRTIKFEIRLRRKDGTDGYFEILSLDELINRNGSLFHPNIWEVVYKRQFTGRKDTHAKDEYEADIVKIKWQQETKKGYLQSGDDVIENEIITTVEFTEGSFHYMMNGKKQSFPSHATKEIIGNIYQNHELLK